MDIPIDVSWLEFVPNGWNLIKLKWTVNSCKNGVWGSEPVGDDAIICLRVADFDRVKLFVNEEDLTFRRIESKDLKGRLLKNGDLLLEKSGGGKKQLVGVVVQYCGIGKAVTSNFIARMEPKKNYSSRFLTYLHAYLYSSRVNVRSIKQTTGIQNLDSSSYLNEVVAIPDLDAQKRIASFLDFKTSQIDEMIVLKEKLKNLLTEKRIVLITQAVTKGLNPKVKLKDSGMDWLGDIPEHWEIKRLKFHSQINPKKSEIKIDSLDVNFVPMENIGEYGGLSLENIKNLFDVKDGYTYFRNNDIIVAKITPCFENGKGALAEGLLNGIAFGTTELHVIRALKSIVPEYLKYVVFSYPFRKLGESSMYGAGGQKRVPTDFIKNFTIGIPPVDEQKQICYFLNDKLEKLDSLLADIKNSIERLKEYKSSLVTAAVTGKIDVSKFNQEYPYEKTH